MTDTAKNTAAAEEGVYETPEDIAAEAAKPAERAARAAADSPIAPVDPFEPGSLGWLLPWAETGEGDVLTPDEALEVFLEWVDARGMELWPHQEDALMDLAVGDSVILGTPTGSGKSMVALGLCFMAVHVAGQVVAGGSMNFQALAHGQRAAQVALGVGLHDADGVGRLQGCAHGGVGLLEVLRSQFNDDGFRHAITLPRTSRRGFPVPFR